MKYHYEKPDIWIPVYGQIYHCDHPLYNSCLLYLKEDRGLAVIKKWYDEQRKIFWYGPPEPWIGNDIYLAKGFGDYFKKHSDVAKDGLYPTVRVREIMWALRMKPLKKEWWESQF